MATITVPVVIGEDRRLVIELPVSTPVGPAEVEVIVRPRVEADVAGGAGGMGGARAVNPAREAARAKLAAAGLLSEIKAPEGAIPLTDEEIARIGQLPPGARPSEELIDEDRGLY